MVRHRIYLVLPLPDQHDDYKYTENTLADHCWQLADHAIRTLSGHVPWCTTHRQTGSPGDNVRDLQHVIRTHVGKTLTLEEIASVDSLHLQIWVPKPQGPSINPKPYLAQEVSQKCMLELSCIFTWNMKFYEFAFP